MKQRLSTKRTERSPTVQERAEAALENWKPETEVQEEGPIEPVQRRIWELERELARLRADPESLKRDSMMKFMASHPQGKVIMMTMMLWYDQYKAEIQDHAPSLYKWLMSPEENFGISAKALRAVALHLEALADLMAAKEQSGRKSDVLPPTVD
jgi:hypothetical protein